VHLLPIETNLAMWALAERPFRELDNLLPNNRRQRRTCYALCHILYPVSAAHTSIFRMDSNSTSYPFLVFFFCPIAPPLPPVLPLPATRIVSVFPIRPLLPPGEG
jgi:hypothetical protein